MAARAAFLVGPERFDVADVQLPPLAAGQALIDVAACGVCASNVHSWRHPELVIAHPDDAAGAVGHEVAGRVTAVAEDVAAAPVPGALVCVEPNLATACGACAACAAGTAWFCRDRSRIATWGFAQRMVLPARALFAVPEGVSAEVATLTEPLACGVHAVRASWTAAQRGRRLDGVRVAVVGAGVTGLLAVAAARHLGAEAVVAMARYPHQAAQAEALGADEVVSADDGDRLRALRPQLVVEAVGGRADTLRLAARVVAPAGEVAVLGLFDEPQPVDTRKAVFRELRVFFPVTYAVIDGVHDFDVALQILAAAPERFAALISHRFPLDRIADAFTTAADKHSGSLRVLVLPS